ncbi:VP-1 [Wuharv (rhesus) parvovirus 1]|uniref:Capsid protein VP1 n=1 Tax=Wuharv (rhesus) parvovirus 1 TaxID=1245561 RepID=K4NU96_9VIRU|nr:VP-1 [Wuharv parvovirus 1]AFV48070.1 VP-1 [Wuharv parvovirus 1]
MLIWALFIWLFYFHEGTIEQLNIYHNGNSLQLLHHSSSLTGWVPPGYNYLGPKKFKLQKKPTNPSDAAARKHDLEYNKLIQQGHNPYFYYNHADEDFIKETNQAKDWGGKFGNYIFRAKRALAPELAPPKKKSKTEKGEPSYSYKNIKPGTKRGKPFYLFVNLAKKKRMSAPAAENNDQQPDAAEPSVAGAKATGGGGGGGSGVGHSTGSFNNRTEFIYHGSEVTIICHATRHIHLNMPDSEEYKIYETNRGPRFPTDQTLQGRDTINDSYHAKVQTPWQLLHANCWGCWFSPADWQQMITTCREFKVEHLEQAIDNIVIKTVTKQGTGAEEITQYNNDLTALLQVAEDKSNLMPWAADNMYIDSIGYVPWRPSKLPTYCYHVNFWNTIDINAGAQQNQWAEVKKGIQWDNIQFTPIENMVDIELLRTGDRWDSGPYTFYCKPSSLEYHWQSTRHTGSCHPSTTPQAIGSVGNNLETLNAWQWGDRNNPSSASTRVSNFHIGYSWPEWQFHYSTGGPVVNPGQPFSQAPWGSEVAGTRLTQGASEKAIYDWNHGDEEHQFRETWWQNNENMTGQTNWAPKNIHQKELTNNVAAQTAFWAQGYHNTFGPFTAFDDHGAQYPWGAIWGKEPNTTHKPLASSHAPFMTANPPGQIFVKLAPNYTDTVDNNGNSSRIVTFGTFWWTGKLVIKAKLRTPRQWNTYQLPSLAARETMKETVPNEIGNFEIPYMPGRAMPNYTL